MDRSSIVTDTICVLTAGVAGIVLLTFGCELAKESFHEAVEGRRAALEACAEVPGRDYKGCMSRELTKRRLNR